MSYLPAVVHFQETPIRVVDRDGKPWLHGPDVARALGYERSDFISRIYARRRDEFTDDMTQVIEIDTPVPDTVKKGVSGKLNTRVRIYSSRGAHLLSMFAETQKAKAFRRWVLDVLERELSPAPVKARAAKASRRQSFRPGVIVVQAEVERVTIYYPRLGGPATLRITGQSQLGPVGIEETMPHDFDRVIRDLVDRHAYRGVKPSRSLAAAK